jgi:hypothetical protein
VEWHRRHLECKPDEQQPERKLGHRVLARALSGHGHADGLEARAADHAVRERNAVEKERARERAEQKILERALGALQQVSADASHDIDRQ